MNGPGTEPKPAVTKVEGTAVMTEVAITLFNGGKIPKRATDQAAAFDLYCPTTVLLPFRRATRVPIGIKTIIEPGYYFQVQSRSGLALKGISTRAGVVDSDFRDEWGVVLFNETNEDVTINMGERIGQAVFHKLPSVAFEELNTVAWDAAAARPDGANRGGGFGSTGK